MTFHVPESGRITAAKTRNQLFASDASYGNNGAFHVQIPGAKPGDEFVCIVSDGRGWEHVSVHCRNRFTKVEWTPSWDEMCKAKSIFWDDEDEVMQLHPAKSNWINCHAHVLHLWRPIDVPIPMPPKVMV